MESQLPETHNRRLRRNWKAIGNIAEKIAFRWHSRGVLQNWGIPAMLWSLILPIAAVAFHHYAGWKLPHQSYIQIYVVLMLAIMAFRQNESSPLEKTFWILGIVMVLAIQGIAVHDQEREDSQYNRTVQQKAEDDFNSIGEGLQNTIRLNQKDFDQTMGRLENLLHETTGGNSYIYFSITDAGGPIEIEIPGSPIHRGEMLSNATMKMVGNYPLHSVFADLVGPLNENTIHYGTVYPHEMVRLREGFYLRFLPTGDTQRFNIFINTSNGSYDQGIVFKRIGGKWLWVSRLSKYGMGHPIGQWLAPGFPISLIPTIWLPNAGKQNK